MPIFFKWLNVGDVVKFMREKSVGKTLCTPGKVASLAFVSTMLGVLVLQQVNDYSVERGSASIQVAIAIGLFVATVFSLLVYVISRAVNKNHEDQIPDDEREILFGAVMSAAMHYLGNSIASFQLIEFEVESCGTVSKETLAQISTMLSSTKYNLKCMSAMENPNAQKINEYIRSNLSNC